MEGLTIQEAAQITGWSPRMLRYIERSGLIEPKRSSAGYRMYGPEQLQRLRTLRELTLEFDITLSDVGFALRFQDDAELRSALATWFETEPSRPADIADSEWLRFEQEKHQRLLQTTQPA